MFPPRRYATRSGEARRSNRWYLPQWPNTSGRTACIEQEPDAQEARYLGNRHAVRPRAQADSADYRPGARTRKTPGDAVRGGNPRTDPEIPWHAEGTARRAGAETCRDPGGQ